jgi:hypothetical protein
MASFDVTFLFTNIPLDETNWHYLAILQHCPLLWSYSTWA